MRVGARRSERSHGMDASAVAGWTDFFVATAGAAAALAGLIFVAVSINLQEVMRGAGLPERAAEAIALLMTVLIVGALCLVPGQPAWVLGIEILVATGCAWALQLRIHVVAVLRRESPSTLMLVERILMAEVPMALLAVGGVTLVVGQGGGLYWLVPAFLLCFASGVFDGWVLSIEILR